MKHQKPQYIEIGAQGLRPCRAQRFANGPRAERACPCDYVRMTLETIAVDRRMDDLRKLRDVKQWAAIKSAAA